MAKTTLANVVSAGAPAMTGPAAIRAYASRVSTSREEVTVEATLPIAPSDRPWTGVTDYHCTNIGMNVQLCVRTDHPPRERGVGLVGAGRPRGSAPGRARRRAPIRVAVRWTAGTRTRAWNELWRWLLDDQARAEGDSARSDVVDEQLGSAAPHAFTAPATPPRNGLEFRDCRTRGPRK